MNYQPFQPLLTSAGLQRFDMTLQALTPCAPLSKVVHSYLQVRVDSVTAYPMIPDASPAIFMSQHGAFIGGAQSRACEIQLPGPGDYFGIRFYPGALRHFFNLDLIEISDQFVDGGYFPQRTFSALADCVYQHPGFTQRAQVCEQWLLRHLQPTFSAGFDQALFLIYQSLGTLKINSLATRVGWSSRHLNRIFQRYTGLSTKAFSQTIRIQHVCRQLSLAPRNSLNTAQNLGYFDQAHLLKEFKQHLLSSPSMYFDRFLTDRGPILTRSKV